MFAQVWTRTLIILILMIVYNLIYYLVIPSWISSASMYELQQWFPRAGLPAYYLFRYFNLFLFTLGMFYFIKNCHALNYEINIQRSAFITFLSFSIFFAIFDQKAFFPIIKFPTFKSPITKDNIVIFDTKVMDGDHLVDLKELFKPNEYHHYYYIKKYLADTKTAQHALLFIEKKYNKKYGKNKKLKLITQKEIIKLHP